MDLVSAQIISTIEVPGYSGKAVMVKSGAGIRLTDLCGSQIGDIFAISAEDHFEFLSPSQTRLFVKKLFPSVGEKFYTNRQRSILKFVEDSSPGIHDMLLASCNPTLFELRGSRSDHQNCQENFKKAITEAGIKLPIILDPVNIFQNTPINPDRSISVRPCQSKPGDSVTFKAEMDLYFVVTACSVDYDIETDEGIIRVNGEKSTPLQIDIFE